jgi:hypothetical protein
MTQWHPVFAQLLRPAVEAYYEVQAPVALGDAPREADFVLLRRTAAGTPPFRGLWRHLTTWNILEFKGPTVSPRWEDVELLVELGLGIDRRLRTERAGQGRPLPAEEVSFWYWPTAWADASAGTLSGGSAAWSPWAPACGAAACWGDCYSG